MLNYLWAGMILLSIVFGLYQDISDEVSNKYNNGHEYTYAYSLTNLATQAAFYPSQQSLIYFQLNSQYPQEIKTVIDEKFPAVWQQVARDQPSENKKELRIKLLRVDRQAQQVIVQLPEVHWVTSRAITDAAFEMAKFAVKLAIGLAGIMALWLGLMRIAEKSGLISYFVRLIYPLLHWLFPAIDKNHPVFGSISLNMAANVLGLGNAATPMGIKAMQQLQELNKVKDTASDEMCMFLAINTSSVQLIPPVTLIAIIGAGVSELIVPIILATTASTIAAVTSAKLMAKMRNA